MTKKYTPTRRSATAISDTTGPQLSMSGHGIRIVTRMSDATSAPNAESRIAVTVASNVIDEFEGQTETRSIWGPNTNRDFVARLLGRRTGTDDNRETVLANVSRFLINRGLAAVIADMIKVPAFKPSETLFTKSDFYRELVKSTNDISVAQAVADLVMPSLMELGMVSSNGRFAAQDEYGFRRVEVADLSNEIAVIQAFAALEGIKLDKINRDNRQSKTVFAESVAELFRPVGLALAQVPELSIVLDDIVRCVRAHITPVGSVGSQAVAIGSFWSSNPLIAELAQCLPFVRAALALPADKELRLSNDSTTLDAWVKLVVQMLRDTPRYKWVSRNEALRHYGIRKIRNVTGAPVSLVAYREVQAEPTAQTVVAVPDAILGESAMFITSTRDRIADTVQAAYGQARFSTKQSVDLLSFVADSMAELGYTGWNGAIQVDAWGNGLTLSDLAVLSSDRVYVEFGENAQVVVNDDSGQFDPVWWFGVNTTERQLKVESGRHLGTEILTCDPVEALLATDDFASKDAMPARKQILGPNAFNATVTGFDVEKVLQPLSVRFSFDMKIAGQAVRGTLRAMDFSSLRSVQLASLVRPHFNVQVIRAAEEAFTTASLMISNAEAAGASDWNAGVKPEAGMFATLQEKCVVKLLQLAQQLSPAFRSEVQEVVMDRVLSSESAVGERAQLLRAKLVQTVFAARCDLLALEFFLHLQGIQMEGWRVLMGSESMERVCALFGTDRELRSTY